MTDEEERALAEACPAVLTNRLYATAGALVRIAFFEMGADGQQHARCAVVMTREDGDALCDLLARVLEAPRE